MRKTLLILGGIVLLCVLLVARLFYTQNSSMNDEREWFAKALRYEFSAQIDSVRMLNEQTGRLWCRITSGNPQVYREDSLKQEFKAHDLLYLIFHRSGDSIIFLIPEGKLVAKGDSVRVSSEKNIIQIFRGGEIVNSHRLADVLTGFSRPFFLRSKE